MLVVLAKLKCKPGERERVVEIAAPCIEATRKEEGCISYELMASTEDANALMFVERWTGMPALEAHQKTAHIAALKEARAPYVDGPSEVSVFEATPR